jgi:fatty acid-binding protein DegV
MKTVQELFKEIKADEGLKEEAIKAYKDGKIEEFAKAHGCNASMDEITAFVKKKLAESPVLALLLG